MLLKRFVCKLLLPRSHPMKRFGFFQSLCFPYLPFISVRSLCRGQACCMFSCTSTRNYPWCCLLLSPSCINTLWAIHQKGIWSGLNERLHWSRWGALASPDLLNQLLRCNSHWQRLNHFPFSKRQDLSLSQSNTDLCFLSYIWLVNRISTTVKPNSALFHCSVPCWSGPIL